MNNIREKELNELMEIFKTSIEEQIGKIFKFSSCYATDYPFEPANFELEMSDKNDFLNNTKYLNKTDTVLIHFTSLEALFSIINEKSIRMYNMNISNDSKEYAYAFKTFKPLYNFKGLKDEVINNYLSNIKSNLFYLSLTSRSNLDKNELWKKYGKNHQGVAIEFTINNDLFDWQNFYLSNVHYGNNLDFKKVKIAWQSIIDKFPINNFKLDINSLLALNKSKGTKNNNWEEEKEIRLILNHYSINSPIAMESDNYIFDDFRTDKNRFNKDIKYFKLPLFTEPVNPSLKQEFPHIKISNIYFGKWWKAHSIEANAIYNKILVKLDYKIPCFEYYKNIVY